MTEIQENVAKVTTDEPSNDELDCGSEAPYNPMPNHHPSSPFTIKFPCVHCAEQIETSTYPSLEEAPGI